MVSFSPKVCHPFTLRMVIWPEASRAQNSMAAVSAEGSTVCVLICGQKRLQLITNPATGVEIDRYHESKRG